MGGTIAHFGRDQRGVIAMLFAIVLVPVMLTIGLALDYGQASSYETQMQRVMDEAVIAGASAMAKTGDAAKAEAVARRRFNATKPKRHPIDLKFSADSERGRIKGEALSSVPMRSWHWPVLPNWMLRPLPWRLPSRHDEHKGVPPSAFRKSAKSRLAMLSIRLRACVTSFAR